MSEEPAIFITQKLTPAEKGVFAGRKRNLEELNEDLDLELAVTKKLWKFVYDHCKLEDLLTASTKEFKKKTKIQIQALQDSLHAAQEELVALKQQVHKLEQVHNKTE